MKLIGKFSRGRVLGYAGGGALSLALLATAMFSLGADGGSNDSTGRGKKETNSSKREFEKGPEAGSADDASVENLDQLMNWIEGIQAEVRNEAGRAVKNQEEAR